jgi:hypothetical protein
VLLPGERSWRRGRLTVLLALIVVCGALGGLPATAGAARHYEKVSPADKGQGDIVGDGETTIASVLGDAVVFNSRTPFGDTIGSGVVGQTQYVARRTDAGWQAHSVTPMPRPDAFQTFFTPTRLQVFSDDLRSAVVWAYDLLNVSGDVPLRNNIYVEDTASRSLEPVTMAFGGQPFPTEFLNLADWGTSADARHVAFVSPSPFLPEAAPGVPNVYQWDDGVLSLAGILPDGRVPSTGSNVRLGFSLTNRNYRTEMSADGSRLLFMATPDDPPLTNPQLYMRIDEARTVWISETEIARGDPGYDPDPRDVVLQAITPDGKNVFFTTTTPLLPGDTNSDTDLYRYTDSDNPSSDANLTLVSDNGGMDSSDVIGVSDDGQRAYYHRGNSEVWVWDHGVNHLVTRNVNYPADNTRERLGLTAAVPGAGRATRDGAYLAFSTFSTPEQAAFAPGQDPNGHRELYLYSLADDTLRCVSCPAGVATSDATVSPAATSGLPDLYDIGMRPRFLSEHGQVFFSTAESLVATDRNGVLDTYEYDPATHSVNLLSTGKGSDPATFADASASGDDVFLVTRQRLVSSDRDDLVDLYDVRNGSALPAEPEAQQPPCDGDACQPPPSAAPPEGLLGSLAFDENGGGGRTPALLTVRSAVRVRGATGAVAVKLTSAGRLTWRGRGLRAGSLRAGHRGTYKVQLRLRKHARARLSTVGSYRTSVRLTFTSTSGDRVTRTTRVTFNVAARKGR